MAECGAARAFLDDGVRGDDIDCGVIGINGGDGRASADDGIGILCLQRGREGFVAFQQAVAFQIDRDEFRAFASGKIECARHGCASHEIICFCRIFTVASERVANGAGLRGIAGAGYQELLYAARAIAFKRRGCDSDDVVLRFVGANYTGNFTIDDQGVGRGIGQDDAEGFVQFRDGIAGNIDRDRLAGFTGAEIDYAAGASAVVAEAVRRADEIKTVGRAAAAGYQAVVDIHRLVQAL